MQHLETRPRPLLRLSVDDKIGACCTCSRPLLAQLRNAPSEPIQSAAEATSTVANKSPEQMTLDEKIDAAKREWHQCAIEGAYLQAEQAKSEYYRLLHKRNCK